MPPTAARCIASIFVTVLAVPAAAQAPSPWVDLPIGASPGATVSAQGKLVLYRDGAFLRVFSAVTNQWHAHTPSAGTSTVLQKDLLLVPESDRWTAFSAYRGVFAVQMVSLAASTIQYGDAIAAVKQGTQLHTFSAFTGQWYSRTIPAGATVQVGNRIATVEAPTAVPALLGAFDAYTGQWNDLPSLPPGVGASIVGGAAVALVGTQLFGFSPLRAAWTQAPIANTFPYPSMQAQTFDGDLKGLLGSVFSAVTGTFAPSPFPPSAGGFVVASTVARAASGSTFYALGAGQNTWVPLPAGIVGSWVNDHIAYGYGNGVAHAFSSLLGTVATTPFTGTSTGIGSRGYIAAVNDPGSRAIYSAFTGQWHAVPANAAPAWPWLHDNSAIYLTTTGATAFAARTGTFVPLAGTGLVRQDGFVVGSSTELHVFDARSGRWLTQASLSGLSPLLGERTVIAADAVRALGYGIRGGQLAAQSLSEPVSAAGVHDDVGYVRTATHLYGFSGLSDTTTWQAVPDGHYGVGLGTRADIQARTPANHVVVLGFGPPGAAPLALPPWGDLLLDPTGTVTTVLVAAPGETRAVVTLAIPNSTALRGTTWLQQTLTLAPGGAIWLGTASSLVVQ